MRVIHLSVECFPIAKVGGLADVIGSLPKFQNRQGAEASVVMPWYDRKFVQENKFEIVAEDQFYQGSEQLVYTIYKEKKNILGFPLYMIKIPGKLDRPEVYAYADEAEQWIAFQHAFLHWLKYHNDERPDVIHCHDHHVGLTPFFMKYSKEFNEFASIKSVITVHNGQYQGWMSWDRAALFPEFDSWKWGVLDWDGQINPLAAGIKAADAFSTVSEGYLKELQLQANGLEILYREVQDKGIGIVNGIDVAYWNPQKDKAIEAKYTIKTANKGKKANKKAFCEAYGLPADRPLLSFIGRFAYAKGADLLVPIFTELLHRNPDKFSIFILGSGDPNVEGAVQHFYDMHLDSTAIYIGYNEDLAHEIYASSDMLLMPSRVEPCGLNQLYALKYGTLPIVRNVGGLHDTIIDAENKEGYGFVFEQPEPGQAVQAVERALVLYNRYRQWGVVRARAMRLDFSWDRSAKRYLEMYESL